MRITSRIDQVLTVITGAVLILMMLHIAGNAILRTFFDAPIHGSNEIVAYWYMPILILLGLPVALARKEHISVTLVTGNLGKKSAKFFETFGFFLGLIMCLGFTWYGFNEAMSKTAIKATAGVTDLISYPAYFAVPLAFVLVALLYLVGIVNNVIGESRPSAPLPRTGT